MSNGENRSRALTFSAPFRQLDGNSTRRRTRSQLYRRGKWSGPSPNAPAPDDDTISQYSDPSYVLGASDGIPELYDPSIVIPELFDASNGIPELFELGDTSLPPELPG